MVHGQDGGAAITHRPSSAVRSKEEAHGPMIDPKYAVTTTDKSPEPSS